MAGAGAFVVAADGALHSCSVTPAGAVAVRSTTTVDPVDDGGLPNYFAVGPARPDSGGPQLLYGWASRERHCHRVDTPSTLDLACMDLPAAVAAGGAAAGPGARARICNDDGVNTGHHDHHIRT